MNKTEFIDFIAKQNDCSKTEAEKAVNLFTNSVIEAVSGGNDVSFIGFGNFTISEVEARAGMNPKTKEPMQIEAYKQVRFRVGQKLKDAANNSEKAKSGSAKDKVGKQNVGNMKPNKAKK